MLLAAAVELGIKLLVETGPPVVVGVMVAWDTALLDGKAVAGAVVVDHYLITFHSRLHHYHLVMMISSSYRNRRRHAYFRVEVMLVLVYSTVDDGSQGPLTSSYQ